MPGITIPTAPVKSEGQIQVNINSQVNSSQIREETLNGRNYWVVPSTTLPFDVVMNGGLYSKTQIEANYQKLDGTLAPLGHPAVNGQHVPAGSPDGLARGYCGAHNRNVRLVGNKVALDKYIDIEVAGRTEQGKRLLTRLEAMKNGTDKTPIHTSVAVFLEREIVVNASAGYDWIAHIKAVDHDAILLDEPGAATPEQGVGMMVNSVLNVNASDAKRLVGNAGVFNDETNYERRARIERAARELLAVKADEYIEADEFTGSQVIIRHGSWENARMYGYKDEAGKIVIDPTGVGVVRKSSWVQLLPNSVQNLLHSLGITQNQARPEDVQKEDEMPLTAEDRAEIGKQVADLGVNLSKSIADAVATQLGAVVTKIDALEANHKVVLDSVTANSRAQDEVKRAAVSAHFKLSKESVAALQANVLDEMHKQVGTAAPIGDNGNLDANGNKSFAMPDLGNYMGKVN